MKYDEMIQEIGDVVCKALVEQSSSARIDLELDVGWWMRRSPMERHSYLDKLHHLRTNNMRFEDDPVLRVEARDDGTYQTLRMFVSSANNIRYYDNRDELPQWVQDRMLMLDMMRDAPLKYRKIEGIGMMVTEVVYWLNPMDEEDNNGYDT